MSQLRVPRLASMLWRVCWVPTSGETRPSSPEVRWEFRLHDSCASQAQRSRFCVHMVMG